MNYHIHGNPNDACDMDCLEESAIAEFLHLQRTVNMKICKSPGHPNSKNSSCGFCKDDEIASFRSRGKELEAEVKKLKTVCAEAYQFCGGYSPAPAEVLDNLSAAANGKPLPHDSFLPVKDLEDKLSLARAAEGLKKFVEYVSTPEKWPKKLSPAQVVQHLFDKAEDAITAYEKAKEGK